ncbi:MAG TPA: hypothetical protein VMH86_10360 [Rhizomicrobium sp.]|nr:hypothetical protein [Rhizomicrobium sp.]
MPEEGETNSNLAWNLGCKMLMFLLLIGVIGAFVFIGNCVLWLNGDSHGTEIWTRAITAGAVVAIVISGYFIFKDPRPPF